MNNVLRSWGWLVGFNFFVPGAGFLGISSYRWALLNIASFFITYGLINVGTVYLPATLSAYFYILSFLLFPALQVFFCRVLWRKLKLSPPTQGLLKIGGRALVLGAILGLVVDPYISYFKRNWLEGFYIPSDSMHPSILAGDRVLIVKTKKQIDRGDIVLFSKDGSENETEPTYYIKRVIGVSGDNVKIATNGRVRINNEWITDATGEETVNSRKHSVQLLTVYTDEIVFEETVPEGRVFVLGDNRANSVDSRTFGSLPLEKISGTLKTVWFSWDSQAKIYRSDRMGVH